jgi:predicted ABC-type ATPase
MAPPHRPLAIVIAGPNGAGKSTSAPSLLRDALQVSEFVNADAIAGGLSAFRPDSVAIPAGRAMLERMRYLAKARADFAFETTLASRSFAPWLARMKRHGYYVHMLFLWLESADLAMDRVAARVRVGGHDVSEATVRRRYERGLGNFFRLYLPLVDSWQMFDNSRAGRPRLVASGRGGRAPEVANPSLWRRISEAYREQP